MTKKIKLVAVALSLSFAGLQAQTPYFRYYKGEKQYFEVSPNKVLVQFAENTDTSVVKNITTRNTSMQVSDIKKAGYKDFSVVSFFGTDTANTQELIRQWKNKDSILYSGPVFVNQEGEDVAALTNQVIVRLKQISDYAVLQKSLESYNINNIRQVEFDSNVYLFNVNYVSEKDAMQISNELHETGLFDYVQPDLLFFVKYLGRNTIPNDIYFPDQWNLLNTGQYGGIPGMDIRATEAWSITTGDSNVIIAIFDNGVDAHPDLIDNLPLGYNSSGGDHGTACAGIAAAKGNNSQGIAGVAYNCKILPFTVGGGTSSSAFANLVDSALKKGVKVISISWKLSGAMGPPADTAICRAIAAGCVLVASSGNGNIYPVDYPAFDSNVIAVGAISPCGERKSPTSCDGEDWGSNYGSKLSLMAPGVLIPTADVVGWNGYNPQVALHPKNNGTILSNDYSDWNYTVWFQGTSSACPHVAGVAALMFSVNPNLTAKQVRNILERTARKVRPDLYTYKDTLGKNNGFWNNEMGYGLVDAYAAVYMAKYGVMPPPTAMISDTKDGTGIEPNPTSEAIWDSPDILVRHICDGGMEHQNPRQDSNCIYVRVKNPSAFISRGGEVVKLYWLKADTALAWGQWSNSTFPHLPMIEPIGTEQLPDISTNSEIVLKFLWTNVPNPTDYECIANDPRHFYLLARIESAGNPMTFPETTDLYDNVRNNNKIAWKHIIIKDSLIDLSIRDLKNDTGAESNPTKETTWVSPDIWVRHNPDGESEHQNPLQGQENTVYVRVKNVGNQTSTGNEHLEVFWSKAATSSVWTDHWNGVNTFFPGGPLIGDHIGTQNIPSLLPGKDTIIEFTWTVPNFNNYKGISPGMNVSNWHFSLLARIDANPYDPMTYTETADVYANAKNNNNIAWKNVSIVEVPTESGTIPEAVVGVWNVYNQVHPFHLEFKRDAKSVSLWDIEFITVKLDNVLYDAWIRGGSQNGKNINYIGNQTFQIIGKDAMLSNLIFLPNEFSLLNMQFLFQSFPSLPVEDPYPNDPPYPPVPPIPYLKDYAYHVIQTDAITDKVIGGHTFQVVETASYRGSSDTNKNTYTDRSDTTQLIPDSTKVELKPNKIVSVQPNPATDQITVVYELNEAQNASISISNYYFIGNSDNYVLDINSQSRTCNIQNYPTGVYVITLICDGQVADLKTFVKQ